MAVIDELLVALGFDYDPKNVKKFEDDIKKGVKVVKDLAKKSIAAASAITALTVASTRASDEQGKLGDEIGASVEDIG